MSGDKLLKRKFELNIDALVFIVVLFVASLGGNAVLANMYSEVIEENVQLQMKGQVDDLNLVSQKAYIQKLEQEAACQQ